MNERIAPALNADEWDAGEKWVGRSAVTLFDECADGIVRIGFEHPTSEAGVSGDLIAATVSLANAALSDADPRKITRLDVQVLREVVGYIEEHGRHHEDVDALIEKLAALLPPEAS